MIFIAANEAGLLPRLALQVMFHSLQQSSYLVIILTKAFFSRIWNQYKFLNHAKKFDQGSIRMHNIHQGHFVVLGVLCWEPDNRCILGEE